MSKKIGGGKLVHIQVTEEVREAFGILKTHYDAPTIAGAVQLYLKDHDPELLQSGKEIVKAKGKILSRNDKPDPTDNPS